jgi:hypothetical protein
MSSGPSEHPNRAPGKVFADGMVAALRSVFFYVLLGNYVGIGALAYEFGFSLGWMVLSTLLVWAAPAQVILISTLGTATLVEVALAVTLSSVRFLPMVAALVPMLRHEGGRQRDLLLPMHLTAISVWVEGVRLQLPPLPREQRVAFYNARHRADIGGNYWQRDRLLSRGAAAAIVRGDAVVFHAAGAFDVVRA